MPELVGAGDLEVTGPPPAAVGALGLQQPMLAHQTLHALAIHRAARLSSREGGDHPGAVRRVRARGLQHDAVGRVQRPPLPRRRPARAPVDRLAADPRDAGDQRRASAVRDQLAGPGDAHAHSQPRKSSPAISTSIVLRPKARSSRAICRRSSSVSVRSVLALQALGSGGEELLAPFPEDAVGDVVLATELGHRLRATQRREHNLGLLLRGELPVPADLAQRRLLLG